MTVGNDIYVGYRRGSRGTYNLDGIAHLTVMSQLLIGYNNNKSGGGNGGTQGTVAGDAVLEVKNDAIRIGPYGASGTLTQTGGHITAQKLRLGQLGLNTVRSGGTINVSAGILDVTDTFWIGDASAGDGVLNLSGTGVVNVTNSVYVGRASKGNCVLNQTGGTLNAATVAIRQTTTSSAGEYYLSNGTLNTTGNLTNNNIFSYTGGTANIGGAIAGIGTTTTGRRSCRRHAVGCDRRTRTRRPVAAHTARLSNAAPAATRIVVLSLGTAALSTRERGRFRFCTSTPRPGAASAVRRSTEL